MYYIKDAIFRNVTTYEGRPCAMVQVLPGEAGGPQLYVYIARSNSDEDGYEIIRMIRSNADEEIDWFDNDMSQATAVVTEEQFGDQGWPSPERQRREFKERLLAYPNIAERLRKELPAQAT